MTDDVVSYILWAHHINDPSWENVSYIRVFECTSPTEFWQLFNSLKNSLQSLFPHHMLFLMKSINGHEIYPKWEDRKNINGGCWSLRIDHNIAFETFKLLTLHLVTNTLSKKNPEYITNGISITPKPKHSIIKIWMENTSKTGVKWYTPQIIDKCPLLEKAVFQIHNNNIKRDYRRKALFQTNRTRRPRSSSIITKTNRPQRKNTQKNKRKNNYRPFSRKEQ